MFDVVLVHDVAERAKVARATDLAAPHHAVDVSLFTRGTSCVRMTHTWSIQQSNSSHLRVYFKFGFFLNVEKSFTPPLMTHTNISRIT